MAAADGASILATKRLIVEYSRVAWGTLVDLEDVGVEEVLCERRRWTAWRGQPELEPARVVCVDLDLNVHHAASNKSTSGGCGSIGPLAEALALLDVSAESVRAWLRSPHEAVPAADARVEVGRVRLTRVEAVGLPMDGIADALPVGPHFHLVVAALAWCGAEDVAVTLDRHQSAEEQRDEKPHRSCRDYLLESAEAWIFQAWICFGVYSTASPPRRLFLQ